jgi:hypothetical protein
MIANDFTGPAGQALLGTVLDELVQRYAGTAETLRGREEFEERRGRVFEDEELWESWTQAFLEWYAVDRPVAPGELSPAALALARESDPGRALALAAWLRSLRVLAEVRALAPGVVAVRDLLGGTRFNVAEQRVLHGVVVGDVVEVRLIGFRGQVYFGRTFCYHPAGTLGLLETRVPRLLRAGHSRPEVLDFCARLRVRCERYSHVTPLRIYEDNAAL